MFEPPADRYKVGCVFIAWLSGHQDHFRMVSGREGMRSLQHLCDLFVLTDELGMFPDPELAAHRMGQLLAMNGVCVTVLPAARTIPVGVVGEALIGARRVVFLDDDPTGTQTVRDLPVLTRWSVEDITWALDQPTAGFFILTNTRSLGSGARGAARPRRRRRHA